jgi:hypothetical protein
MEQMPGAVPEGILLPHNSDDLCTVSGRSEVPAGEVAFILRITGRLKPHSIDPKLFPVGLRLFLLDEGTTFQELLDRQGKPGRFFPIHLQYDAPRIKDEWRNESRQERYRVYGLEAGDHVLITVGSDFPHSPSLCGEIWVVEAPSG